MSSTTLGTSRAENRFVLALVLMLLLLVTVLSGCGGGGGGGNSGSTTAPTRSNLTGTLNWPDRTRAVNAPTSALSVKLTATGADGGSFAWLVNRNTTKIAAYSDTFQSPQTVASGTWKVDLAFYTDPNGTGDLVANATTQTVVTEAGGDLGTVAVIGRIAKVVIAPHQTVAVGQTLTPTCTVSDSNGATIAVKPGAVRFAEVQDLGRATLQSGDTLIGKASGAVRLVATVDGISSAPETVYVGTLSFNLATSGTRGTVILNDNGNYETMAAGRTVAFDKPWLGLGGFQLPATYGDRRFDHWDYNGANIGTTNDLSAYIDAFAAAGGTLTAVYVPQAASAGGFQPNYNLPDNLHWSHFPVRVWLGSETVPASMQPLLTEAMDWWAAASGNLINYQVVSDRAQADIVVDFTTVSSGRLGLTTVHFTDGNTLKDADIALSPGLLPVVDAKTRENLVGTMAHEFGHSLGIIGGANGGHSPDTHDLMYATRDGSVNLTGLNERDCNTIANIYASLYTSSRRVEIPSQKISGAPQSGTVLHTLRVY